MNYNSNYRLFFSLVSSHNYLESVTFVLNPHETQSPSLSTHIPAVLMNYYTNNYYAWLGTRFYLKKWLIWYILYRHINRKYNFFFLYIFLSNCLIFEIDVFFQINNLKSLHRAHFTNGCFRVTVDMVTVKIFVEIIPSL